MRVISSLIVAISLQALTAQAQTSTTTPSKPPDPKQAEHTAQSYSTTIREFLLRPFDSKKPALVPGCESQVSLKQFPFVKINEYSGEAYVGEFGTPKGKFWADRRNTIRVCIDPTVLTEDAIYSQGDISLAAQLGDRAVSVEGFAEIGKNFEKFQPAAVRTVQYALNYGTIVQLSREALGAANAKDYEVMAARSQVVADVFSGLLETPQSALATARITEISETELKTHSVALRDSVKNLAIILKDSAANAAQVDAAIAATKTRLEAVERELLSAVSAEADVAANPNSDAKRKEAARVRTVELSALHLQLRTELRALQTRKGTIADAAAAIKKAVENLESSVKRVQQVFKLGPDAAAPAIVRFTSTLRAGQIYLRKEDAKRGDVLRVQLLHFPPEFKADGKVANGAPVIETLAEIHIDEFGWKSDVVDSFLLVKAMDKKLSNFKAAAGASLLFSYRPRASASHSVVRTLTPSVGANVSYLDFDPDKDFEVGAGVVFGLFENQIHFGYGMNLNYDKAHRGYFFVGFSFGKIQEKLTGNDN